MEECALCKCYVPNAISEFSWETFTIGKIISGPSNRKLKEASLELDKEQHQHDVIKSNCVLLNYLRMSYRHPSVDLQRCTCSLSLTADLTQKEQ